MATSVSMYLVSWWISKHPLCHFSRKIQLWPARGFWEVSCRLKTWRTDLSKVFLWITQKNVSTDYEWEDGHFLLVYAIRVTISNPQHLLSSSETGITLGVRSWEKNLSEWARCHEAIYGIYFTKNWRAETLYAVSPIASSCWTGHFLGMMIGIFWKRKSRPI